MYNNIESIYRVFDAVRGSLGYRENEKIARSLHLSGEDYPSNWRDCYPTTIPKR